MSRCAMLVLGEEVQSRRGAASLGRARLISLLALGYSGLIERVHQ